MWFKYCVLQSQVKSTYIYGLYLRRLKLKNYREALCPSVLLCLFKFFIIKSALSLCCVSISLHLNRCVINAFLLAPLLIRYIFCCIFDFIFIFYVVFAQYVCRNIAKPLYKSGFNQLVFSLIPIYFFVNKKSKKYFHMLLNKVFTQGSTHSLLCRFYISFIRGF